MIRRTSLHLSSGHALYNAVAVFTSTIILCLLALVVGASSSSTAGAFICRQGSGQRNNNAFVGSVASLTNGGPTSSATASVSPILPSTAATTISSSSTTNQPSTTAVFMADDGETKPTTFREAEVLGLKLMQEGNYEDALKAFQAGMKLPGSRPDVIRTKSLSGPSPVGGSMGGYESQNTMTLDEFEYQAAHYNMACAHAQLDQLDDSIQQLDLAFRSGFDNYATVRDDPDLDPIKNERDYQTLMEQYEGKDGKKGGGSRGFNPFGLFGGGKS